MPAPVSTRGQRPRSRTAAPRRDAIGWLSAATFVLFWITCAFAGGSSRATAASLLILRPVTVTCLGVFLVLAEPSAWRAMRVPALLLAALAGVMACQLVPLPPGLWLALPGRARFLPGLALMGGQGEWHALSVAPDRTWDSLIGLLVPATALAGHASLDARSRRLVLPGLLILVGASACLGVAQLVGGEGGPYLFTHSDLGFPVGFFANKNHQSALLVAVLPFLRAWTLLDHGAGRGIRHRNGPARPAAGWRAPAAAAAGLALVPAVIVTGSRAGLLLLPLGLLAAWLVRPVAPLRGLTRARALLAGGVAVVVAVALPVLVLVSGRALAVQRLLDRGDVLHDQRFDAAGTVTAALRAGFPAGWGFGTFDPVFRMFEPDRLLGPTYFNNAHDDLLELLLTGGLPAALILAGFLFWLVRRALRAFWPTAGGSQPERANEVLARASAFAIAIVLLASLLDYPLRTPLFGAVLAIWCLWLDRVRGPLPDPPCQSGSQPVPIN